MFPLKEFNVLKKNLKKDFTGLKKISVAVLGDTATQLLVQAIRATGYDARLNIELWEADYNLVENLVFDPGSHLYSQHFDYIIISRSSHKLLQKYNKLPPAGYASLASGELALIKGLVSAIGSHGKTPVLYYNYPEIDDAVFGSFSSKTATSFIHQLRKLNFELMEYAAATPSFHLLDIGSVQGQLGRSVFFSPSLYINTEMVFSLTVLPRVASLTTDMMAAYEGKFKKCIILDLDNTLWGGIIGDDGSENIQLGALGIGKAFTELQYWLKKLKNRGIILAVCSKNTESVARGPFLEHADMVLHLEDIAVFVANWENKVDNIHHIQKILNIGYDSMVFLDDNPFERNILRAGIPELTVPELPEDPADYLEYLYSLNLFETASFSGEDAGRTKQYQVEAERTSVQKLFENEDDFLKSLLMISKVEGFNKFNIPRVAQLSQRSNQFNLRTVRYNEPDIISLGLDDSVFPFTFTLDDKFGSNGLVCIVILKKKDEDNLFIETWLMSCRVLKRGMENFVLNTLVSFAADKNYSFLLGEYLPTPKNVMVKDHYSNLGFGPYRNYFRLNIRGYTARPCFIKLHHE